MARKTLIARPDDMIGLEAYVDGRWEPADAYPFARAYSGMDKELLPCAFYSTQDDVAHRSAMDRTTARFSCANGITCSRVPASVALESNGYQKMSQEGRHKILADNVAQLPWPK